MRRLWLLARVLQRSDLDVNGEGHGTITARGWHALQGAFSLGGVWDSLAVAIQGGFAWRNQRLLVQPLAGKSAAGDLAGTVTWSGMNFTMILST